MASVLGRKPHRIKMEFIPLNLNVTDTLPYAPDDNCFNWCLEQQVVHSNNMEIYGVMFPAAAYIFILLYLTVDKYPKLEKYKSMFIYWAKLSLIMFFAFYILIIRLRLLW